MPTAEPTVERPLPGRQDAIADNVVGSNPAVQANATRLRRHQDRPQASPQFGIRDDDRLNVGTSSAEWYASSHSFDSAGLREWYTSCVHVALQQYAIRSMSSGVSAPSLEVAHGEYRIPAFLGVSGTPPAYISDGRLRNLVRPSVGYRSRPALRPGRHVAGGACRPDHPHLRRSRVSTSPALAGEVGFAEQPASLLDPAVRERGPSRHPTSAGAPER
jgi:hypothetical protein